MERINIAELLKDCPQGMELDCIAFDTKVTYQGLSKKTLTHPIIVQTKHGFELELTQWGQIHNIVGSKCVIFPKGKTTWEGFVPPCKFKDGDIITDLFRTCIFKGEGKFEGTVNYYCGISDDVFHVKDDRHNPNGHFGYIVNYRLSTEEEKQKLFQAIKDNGYKWNPETKALEQYIKFRTGDKVRHKYGNERIISFCTDDGYWTTSHDWISRHRQDEYELVPNKFDINTLEPYEKVLVRLTRDGVWHATFFSHYDREVKWGCYPFVTTSSKSYSMCIPYKGNEHLRGTNDDCNEYYKTWKE